MEFINDTLGNVLNKLSRTHSNNLAIKHYSRNYCRTWKEFNDDCNEVAKGLLGLGIKKGDHIAIWATNIPEWLILLYATAKIGGVLVTVNTNYKVFELEYLLRQSDTKMLVMLDKFKDSNYVEIVRELCPQIDKSVDGYIKEEKLPFLERIVIAGTDSRPKGMLPFDRIKEFGKNISDEELLAITESLSTHDIVNIQYTSGTTGFPKGVMLTHYNILNNGKSIGDCMKFTDKDKMCTCVPLFHCFGLVLATMATLTHATPMVLVDYFRPIDVLNVLQNDKCTAVHGVPTMFIAMLEHPEFKNYKFNLRTGIMAGSPCPVKVMEQTVKEMGMSQITIVYGQTEASPGCTQTSVEDSLERRVQTVGRMLPGVEGKIVDPETGLELPPNTPGEFCARGYNIMQGYYKMPEATNMAIDKDGWLHTGDICTVDEEGYYKVVGRIKDMIIRGGENIYPKEIEEFLYTHPKISDVQVIGVPSEQYGEEVLAEIILKQGESMTEDEVKEFVLSHMARHKVPKYVQFVDSFPTNAAGKIQKYKMREEAILKLNLQKAANIETA